MFEQRLISVQSVIIVTLFTFSIGFLANCLSLNNIVQQNQLPIEQKSTTSQEHQRQYVQNYDQRRPVWALAHMVNSIQELDYRLGKGANAIESDITFGSDGDPLYTYHGPPCDCWRHCHQQEDFVEFLKYVREIAIDQEDGVGKNLSLLFLDLKLDALDHKAKARAGTELAKAIAINLFHDSEASAVAQLENSTLPNESLVGLKRPKRLLHLILSVNHVTDIDLVQNFVHYFEQNNSSHLMKRIGFDVGMNDDLQLIESMWRRFGNTLNLWQGDGYTNCFSPFYNLERLSRAIQKRDLPIGYPSKVYHWTIDLHDRMRESLRMGVDAIMTNHPERLLTVLREPDLAHDYRLATSDDNPFKKILRSSTRSSETARYQRSTSTSNGGFIGNLMDILQSWFNYIREIPFLSLPATSRIFRQNRRQSNRLSLFNTTMTPTTIATTQQPEYQVDLSPSESTVTGTVAKADVSDMLDQQQPPYEGPKWYTSLVSNILVSVMKIILPT